MDFSSTHQVPQVPSVNFFITFTMWNVEHEQYLLLIHQYCDELVCNYHNKYIIGRKKLCYYRLPTIVLMSLTGFLSISNVGYFTVSQSKYISLLCGVVNLLVSIVNTVESFKKIESKMNIDVKTYYDLVRLRDDISVVLSMPVSDRKTDGITAVYEAFERFEQIIKEGTVLHTLPSNMLAVKQLQKESKGEEDTKSDYSHFVTVEEV